MLIDYSYSLSDAIGNCGVVLLLGAFFLLQTGKIKAESVQYNILNGVAAVLLLTNLLVKPNLSGIIIEIWWLCLSIYGYWKISRRAEK